MRANVYLEKFKDSKWLLSILLNIILILPFLLFAPLNYEMADDVGYAQYIADGYYNIKFLSFFLLNLMGLVQKIIYPLNAYVVVNIIASFLAFIAISRVFLEKFNTWLAVSFTLFLYAFFGVNHFETISFTRNPALISVAGFLCIIHFSSCEKWKLGSLYGSFLLIWGSGFRFQIFEVSVVVAAIFVVALSFRICLTVDKTQKLKEFFKNLFEPKRLAIVTITVVLCFLINFASTYINTLTSDLDYFYNYTNARSSVWDYSIPDYDVCKEQYGEIGIDKNDIEMLRAGYMDNEGAFSLDKLRAIKEVQTAFNNSNKSVYNIIKNMFVIELGFVRGIGDRGVALIAFVVFLILFCVLQRARNFVIPLSLVLVTFTFYLYLHITGKVVYRAVYGLWLGSIVYMMYSFDKNEIRDRLLSLYKRRKKICIISTSCFFVLISVLGVFLSNISNNSIKAPASVDVQNQKELNNYLVNHYNDQFEIARGISISKDIDTNIYFIGKSKLTNYKSFNCTYYKLPKDTDDMIQIFGTDNMYKNLLNDNVYFVSRMEEPIINNMEKYLEKYYSNEKNVKCKLIKNINDIGIYKYYI